MIWKVQAYSGGMAVIMKKFMDRLLDILLYPVSLYEKLNDKKGTLIAGIVLVGAIDLFLPDVSGFIKLHFTGKPANTVFINAILAVFITVVLGIVDVAFISIPLFDFFKFLKKKEVKLYANIYQNAQNGGQGSIPFELPQIKMEDPEHKASSIKVMKAYIMSHFLFVPVSLIINYAFLRDITTESPVAMQYLALIVFMLIFIWSAAILTRGINALFRFNPMFRMLTFIIVFSWSYLFGMVFDLQIMNWLVKLLR